MCHLILKTLIGVTELELTLVQPRNKKTSKKRTRKQNGKKIEWVWEQNKHMLDDDKSTADDVRMVAVVWQRVGILGSFEWKLFSSKIAANLDSLSSCSRLATNLGF